MDTIQYKDLSINEIFNDVINLESHEPHSYPLDFELDSLKEIFEFLLQFITMLCKHFYADSNGQVDLEQMSPNDFLKINLYMSCIGFNSNFLILPANSANIEYANNNKYDRVNITVNTKLKSLLFGLKSGKTLYIISFDYLPNY